MKRKRLAAFLICCIFLSGCAGRQLEEELLVIVLTVDKKENGGFSVSVKVPSSASENADKDKGTGSYLMLEAGGSSFLDAVSMLNASTPRKLNFSQVREILIGEEAAKTDDFRQLLRQIDSLPRFRCSAALIVCRGEAKAFSELQKPILGIRLSRYADATISNFSGKGFTPDTTLCDAIRDLGYGFQDPLLILGAVNDFSGGDDPEQENTLNTLAGSLSRKSAEKVELFGAAVTDGEKVCGCLTGYEMALIHLIQGYVEALSIPGENGEMLHITAKKPSGLQVDIQARPVKLSVTVYCAAAYQPGRPRDAAYVKNRLTKDVLSVIRHMQSLGCDGIGFGGKAARQTLTVQEWERLNWKRLYPDAEVIVNISLTCREN